MNDLGPNQLRWLDEWLVIGGVPVFRDARRQALAAREQREAFGRRAEIGARDAMAAPDTVTCRRCKMTVEAGCEPDGCRDPDCPMLYEVIE